MEQIISTNEAAVKKILKENQVKRAYWFGSAISGNFTEKSDIDILIGFDDSMDPIIYGDNYFNVLSALQQLFKREIDLLTEKSLKNPYLIKHLNETRKVIYE